MKWFKRRECARCKELEQGLARLKSIDFQASETDQMVLHASFDGAAVKLFAASAVHWFRESGGKNFVTLELTDPKTGEGYQLTMQRKGGISPAQKLRELEQRLADREVAGP